jgi:hypothetical protein
VTRTFFPISLILCLPSEGREGKIFFTQTNSSKKNKKKNTTTQLLAIMNNLWGLGDLLFFSGNF